MAEIKVVWYDTVCECPEWAIELPAHCSGDCSRCGYPTLHKHIVNGSYKRIDYDEENGTFTFGNRKIEIDDIYEPVFPSWIDYLEVDGEVIIGEKNNHVAEDQQKDGGEQNG